MQYRQRRRKFQVNTYSEHAQQHADVAGLTDGGYIVTYHSFNNLGDHSYDIYAQRYNADNNPVGTEFRVNTHITDVQKNSSVVALDNGEFVILWESFAQSGDGDLYGIFGWRFDANNNPIGGEFQVNTYTSGNQVSPTLSRLDDGGFVAIWTSDGQDGSGKGVYARRFDADNNPISNEFQIATTTANDQTTPSVATLNDGSFVVTWSSVGQDGSEGGIFARHFDADGTALSGEIPINATTTNDQTYPSIAALAEGGFAVIWASESQDGSGYGIFGRRFDGSGNVIGDEFQANTFIAGQQINPKVAGLPDGGFTVTWQSNEQDGSGYGIFGQQFDRDGNRIGSEFQINTTNARNQTLPDIAALNDGRLAVAWQSSFQDIHQEGIFARTFNGIPEPEATANQAPQLSAIDFSAQVFTHAGNTDPAQEGWSPAIFPGNSVGPVNDGGIEAWRTLDSQSILGSIAAHQRGLASRKNDLARLYGWKYNANLRVLDNNDRPNGSIALSYTDGLNGYRVFLGSNADGDTLVRMPDDFGAPIVTLEGVKANEYHDYELAFDPTDKSITLFVDGEAKIENYSNQTASEQAAHIAASSLILWGSPASLDTGEAYWQSVRFETLTPEATQNEPFTLSYEALLAASDATDADNTPISFQIESVNSGTLTKDGADVVAGTTTIAPGQSVVWTPNSAGDRVSAFSVRATDGEAFSASAVDVAIPVVAGGELRTGTEEGEVIHTGDGNDTLVGAGGDDTIYGSGDSERHGNDSIVGGAGDDSLFSGHPFNVVDGGEGIDRIHLDNATYGVKIEIESHGTSPITYIDRQGAEIQRQLFNIEQVVGTRFDDSIVGDEGNNSIFGNDGMDTLIGGAGDDFIAVENSLGLIDGGDGTDRLALGNDTYAAIVELNAQGSTTPITYVDSENNTIAWEAYNFEIIDGTKFDDSIVGDGNGNSLRGHEGNDTILGGDGNDELRGLEGDDSIVGGEGNDYIEVSSGFDDVDGGPGLDTVRVNSTTHAVEIELRDSEPSTIAYLDTDGNRTERTLVGIEQVFGSQFDDAIAGDSKGNLLRGYEGNDTLVGNGGNDNLQGGAGDDSIVGGEGADYLEGNEGNDIFQISHGAINAQGDGADFIADFTAGEDRIFLSDILARAGETNIDRYDFEFGPNVSQATVGAAPKIAVNTTDGRVFIDGYQNGMIPVLTLSPEGAQSISLTDFSFFTDTSIPTINVNSFADNLISGDGLVTLREAVIAANTGGTTDLGETGTAIALPAGTFELSLAGAFEDAAARGDLDITSEITIRGAGEGLTTIDANEIDRVFHVLGSGNLTLEDVTITGGKDSFHGGGILIDPGSVATVTNSTIANNTAPSGGGIQNSGTLTVVGSDLSNNSSTGGAGGAIRNSGNLTVSNSSIFDNYALTGGGGLFNSLEIIGYPESVALVENSEIFNNTADSSGGGIENWSNLTVTNSMISGNISSGSFNGIGHGGGISNAFEGNLTVTGSNISGNTALSSGGGISNTDRAADFTVTNNTIANNTVSSSSGFGGGISSSDSPATTTLNITDNSFSANVAANGSDTSTTGGFGDDTIVSGGNGNAVLNGDSGNDILNSGNGNDVLNGGDGNDTLHGGLAGSDFLDGGSGDDVVSSDAGSDVLNGGDGNDTLFGGSGGDALNGGSGNDTLSGGSGSDILNGGSGFNLLGGGSELEGDRFDLDIDGFAEIADFQPGFDIIGLPAELPFSSLIIQPDTNPANTLIHNGITVFARLNFVSASTITASYFQAI